MVFGPYSVLASLGEGGMATVYLAHDAKHGRRVALKVMKAETSEAIGPERFIREIETVARLTHPNILPLYDSGSEDGRLYYVMPHIAGGSLRARLDKDRTLPLDEAVRLTRHVAAALEHAHQQGLVHRDIKPENVLIADGIALVADFGIARSTGTALESSAETRAMPSPITRAHVLLGTPQYMAPEQAFGEGPADARADIYALGCVLFEMLTGRPPFTAATVPALLMRVATEAPPPIGALRPEVPAAVSAVVEKALAKQPGQRYASAAEMREALTEAMTRPAGSAVVAETIVPAGDVRLAVLPFQNLGGTPDDECLSDGICDELIHTLGRIDGVRVTARGSSFQFRDRRADIRAIGAELHVTQIIDGTLRRAGKRVRVTAQLINATDGFQTWSDRYDRELDDVFALQDDIAGAIASVLRVKLRGAAAGAASFEAYEQYLVGIQHWNKRTPQDLDRAVEALAEAVRLDPKFAPAWGATAMCQVTRLLYGAAAPRELVIPAREAADRALALDRQEVAALTARACIRAIHDWDVAAAERDFREVIASAPSDAIAHQWCAVNLLAPLGRLDEARAMLDRARELDPLSPSVLVSAALVASLAGDPQEGLALCERALTLDPSFSAARYFIGPMLAASGQFEAAVAALEAAAAGMRRSPEVLAALAVVYADAGDSARARDLLTELERLAATRYVSPALTATVRAAQGDLDGAFVDLHRAMDVRAAEVIWFETRKSYQPLRRDARFQGIRERRAGDKIAAASTRG